MGLSDAPCKAVGLVYVVTGGAGDNVTTKGLTGSMKLLMICAVEFGNELGCPWAAQAVTRDRYGSTGLL